jgi:hypothetical protein
MTKLRTELLPPEVLPPVNVDRTMSEVTYYVALPFVASDDGIAPGNPNAAVMRAEALSEKQGCVGAVASAELLIAPLTISATLG